MQKSTDQLQSKGEEAKKSVNLKYYYGGAAIVALVLIVVAIAVGVSVSQVSTSSLAQSGTPLTNSQAYPTQTPGHSPQQSLLNATSLVKASSLAQSGTPLTRSQAYPTQTPGQSPQQSFFNATSLVKASFDYQLGGIKQRDIQVYIVDGFDYQTWSPSTYEDWRPDAASLTGILGKKMEEWDEFWLNIKRLDVLELVMRNRITIAKNMGCVGIEWDNVDGFDNDNGVGLTIDDGVAYIKALAQWSHEAGLLSGLKNALDTIPFVEPFTDFAVNEQCTQYKECGVYKNSYIAHNKPVFGIGYPYKGATNTQICTSFNQAGLNAIVRDLNLTPGGLFLPC